MTNGSTSSIIFTRRAKEALEALEQLGRRCESKLPENLDDLTLLDLVQNHYLRISWKKEVLRELNDIYAGDAFEAVRSEIVKIHDRVLRGRVFIALHMHAGDGNVPYQYSGELRQRRDD